MFAHILIFVIACSAQVKHLAFDMKWFPYDTDDFYIHPFFAMLVCIIAIGVLLVPCLVLTNAELYYQHKEQRHPKKQKE